MITGETKSGFKFAIPEGMGNDFMFVKAYRDVSSDDNERVIDGAYNLVAAVFADSKEEDRFYKHLKERNGSRVPVDVLLEEINEIISIASEKDNEAKNS